MSSKGVAQQKQQNWYISRSYFKLREAKNYQRLGKCAEAVNSSFESVEFSVKALCKILDVEYNKQHFIDQFSVAKLATKVGETWPEKRERLLSVLPIILSYSDKLREIARYGVETEGIEPISPDQVFQKDYCDKVLEDAESMVDILSQIELSQRWNPSRPTKMCIFNGFSTNPRIEKACEPVNTFKDTSFWERYFAFFKRKKGQKYDFQRVLSTGLNEEFAIALNPFGEVYPEVNVRSRDTYEQIKFFIENGGVVANTAGFAFFYSWDHTKGEMKAISEERLVLVRTEKEEMKSLVEAIGFAGTFLYLDFGAFVTSGSPIKVETYQKPEDIEKFGKLTATEVKEFRALRSETKNCVPILRGKSLEFGDIYPIAALRFGKGYLVLGGFLMENETEAKLFADAVDAFCNWISTQYTPMSKA